MLHWFLDFLSNIHICLILSQLTAIFGQRYDYFGKFGYQRDTYLSLFIISNLSQPYRNKKCMQVWRELKFRDLKLKTIFAVWNGHLCLRLGCFGSFKPSNKKYWTFFDNDKWKVGQEEQKDGSIKQHSAIIGFSCFFMDQFTSKCDFSDLRKNLRSKTWI